MSHTANPVDAIPALPLDLLTDASVLGYRAGFTRPVHIDAEVLADGPELIVPTILAAYTALSAAPTGAVRVRFQVVRTVAGIIDTMPLVIDLAADERDGYVIGLPTRTMPMPPDDLEKFVYRLVQGYRRAIGHSLIGVEVGRAVIMVLLAALDEATAAPNPAAAFARHLEAVALDNGLYDGLIDPVVAVELTRIVRHWGDEADAVGVAAA